MKNFLRLLSGVAAALAVTAAFATTTVQTGWNPTTGLNGTLGLDQTVGTAPSAATSTCSGGSVTVVGGPNAGTATTATCTTGFVGVLVWTIPALGSGGVNGNGGYGQAAFAPTVNGAVCSLVDITTGANNTIANTTAIGVYVAPTATAAGTITCTFASKTIVAADVLAYSVELY